jgi:tripartite-type tricarboxylate transporter receptor subunit TctC
MIVFDNDRIESVGARADHSWREAMRDMVRAVATMVVACVCAVVGNSPAMSAYPERPIRLLVSFPPGGSSDAMARIVQPGLERLLGHPIIIENRAGAGGMLAIDVVAKAPPDGYLIGLGGAGALGTNLALQERMPYDPRKDVAPVSGLAGSPFILAAAPSFQGTTLRDVIAQARTQGDKLSIGHGGNGTLMHLTAEMFNQMAGTKVALVPYRGIAPVVSDLVGNHVALGIIDPPSGMAQIEAKQLKTIAVSSAKRFARLPQIPTLAESGLPGFESNGWFGIVVPAATPADVIATLNMALVKVLKEPDVVERIRALGAEPMPMTPAEYGAFIRTEIDKWLKVVGAGKPN